MEFSHQNDHPSTYEDQSLASCDSDGNQSSVAIISLSDEEFRKKLEILVVDPNYSTPQTLITAFVGSMSKKRKAELYKLFYKHKSAMTKLRKTEAAAAVFQQSQGQPKIMTKSSSPTSNTPPYESNQSWSFPRSPYHNHHSSPMDRRSFPPAHPHLHHLNHGAKQQHDAYPPFLSQAHQHTAHVERPYFIDPQYQIQWERAQFEQWRRERERAEHLSNVEAGKRQQVASELYRSRKVFHPAETCDKQQEDILAYAPEQSVFDSDQFKTRANLRMKPWVASYEAPGEAQQQQQQRHQAHEAHASPYRDDHHVSLRESSSRQLPWSAQQQGQQHMIGQQMREPPRDLEQYPQQQQVVDDSYSLWGSSEPQPPPMHLRSGSHGSDDYTDHSRSRSSEFHSPGSGDGDRFNHHSVRSSCDIMKDTRGGAMKGVFGPSSRNSSGSSGNSSGRGAAYGELMSQLEQGFDHFSLMD